MTELMNYVVGNATQKSASESLTFALDAIQKAVETQHSLAAVNKYLVKTNRHSQANDDTLSKEIDADIELNIKRAMKAVSTGENDKEKIASLKTNLSDQNQFLCETTNEHALSLESIKELCDRASLVFIPLDYVTSNRIGSTDKQKGLMKLLKRWGVEPYVITNLSSLDLSKIDFANMKALYLGKYQSKILPIIASLLPLVSLPFRVKNQVLSEYKKIICDLEKVSTLEHAYTWLTPSESIDKFDFDLVVRKCQLNLIDGKATVLKSKTKVGKTSTLNKKSSKTSVSPNKTSEKAELTYRGIAITRGTDNLLYASILDKGYKTISGIQSGIRTKITQVPEKSLVDTYKGYKIMKDSDGNLSFDGSKRCYSSLSGAQSAIRSLLKRV